MSEAIQQNNESRSKTLPAIEPLTTLEYGGNKITILGTAHVSQASADKVKELIATGQYDAVAVELCPSRYKA
ncbi:MAG TPA: TraB/GumN family protein, partial [Nitrosomonas sp.]|nr:TraB/GumN family protein [Nitrosomonas sp.]